MDSTTKQTNVRPLILCLALAGLVGAGHAHAQQSTVNLNSGKQTQSG